MTLVLEAPLPPSYAMLEQHCREHKQSFLASIVCHYTQYSGSSIKNTLRLFQFPSRFAALTSSEWRQGRNCLRGWVGHVPPLFWPFSCQKVDRNRRSSLRWPCESVYVRGSCVRKVERVGVLWDDGWFLKRVPWELGRDSSLTLSIVCVYSTCSWIFLWPCFY